MTRFLWIVKAELKYFTPSSPPPSSASRSRSDIRLLPFLTFPFFLPSWPNNSRGREREGAWDDFFWRDATRKKGLNEIQAGFESPTQTLTQIKPSVTQTHHTQEKKEEKRKGKGGEEK
jgi:hypothetical protein